MFRIRPDGRATLRPRLWVRTLHALFSMVLVPLAVASLAGLFLGDGWSERLKLGVLGLLTAASGMYTTYLASYARLEVDATGVRANGMRRQRRLPWTDIKRVRWVAGWEWTRVLSFETEDGRALQIAWAWVSLADAKGLRDLVRRHAPHARVRFERIDFRIRWRGRIEFLDPGD